MSQRHIKEPKATKEACPKSNFLFVTLFCGLRPKLSRRMIYSFLGLEAFFEQKI